MKYAFIRAALSGAAFLFALGGCASRDLSEPWARGFTRIDLTAPPFRLAAYSRLSPADTLTVYIEGDGAPWRNPYQPPDDPTPSHPLALTLAAQDTSPAVLYLARPCQYLNKKSLQQCDITYWTERRFSEEVISAYDDALNQIKTQFQFKYLRLIGYSGGGVIATLLADKRADVQLLVTVAAPLAVSEWVHTHKLSPLSGSLDPAQQQLHLPPSLHFAGEDDKIVPEQIVRTFTRLKGGRLMVVPGFDHQCCWSRDWTALIRNFPVQEALP